MQIKIVISKRSLQIKLTIWDSKGRKSMQIHWIPPKLIITDQSNMLMYSGLWVVFVPQSFCCVNWIRGEWRNFSFSVNIKSPRQQVTTVFNFKHFVNLKCLQRPPKDVVWFLCLFVCLFVFSGCFHLVFNNDLQSDWIRYTI